MKTEDQPLPGSPVISRNCTNCAFSVEQRESPPSIQKRRICVWGPPQMVPTITAQGITINVMHPPVNETVLCNQHRFISEVANANPSPTKGPPN